MLILIGLVGGRVTPSFTRNWLAKQDEGKLPAPFDGFDKLALATLVLALLTWTVLGVDHREAVALRTGATGKALTPDLTREPSPRASAASAASSSSSSPHAGASATAASGGPEEAADEAPAARPGAADDHVSRRSVPFIAR